MKWDRHIKYPSSKVSASYYTIKSPKNQATLYKVYILHIFMLI